MFSGWKNVNTFSAHRSASHQLSVSQTDPFIASRVRLTLVEEERPFFNTAAYPCPSAARKSESAGRDSEYWWRLWHLGNSDRAVQWSWNRIRNSIKMEVSRSLFSVCCNEIFSSEKKNLNFEIKISWLSDLHSSLICIKALDNHGSYLCSLRPKLEAALRLICSKLRKSWKETLQLLSPNSYNLI